MTGNADAGNRLTYTAAQPPLRHYIAVDGGAGARLFTALPDMVAAMRPVSSPRHADLLIVAGPVSAQLAPAIAELARALPAPAQALLLVTDLPDKAALQRLFPGAPTVMIGSNDSIDAITRVAEAIHNLGPPTEALRIGPTPAYQPPLIPLPGASEHEIATELIAFSLGPLQPFTAGPLRLWLICDGEQVLQCRVDTGFAARDLAGRMAATDWRAAADLAAQLDPLAPVAARLAYVRAVEALQGWRAPPQVERAREAALALERAANHLEWATRFFRLLAAPRLTEQAADMALRVQTLLGGSESATHARIVPQGPAWGAQAQVTEMRQWLAAKADHLARQVKRDRLLWLRTRAIGALPQTWIVEAGVTGPNAEAPARGVNDCHARLLARLVEAARDLRQAPTPDAAPPDSVSIAPERAAEAGPLSERWIVPAGVAEGEALGPRGRLSVRVVSGGGAGPARVEWTRPSAQALALLPRLLQGQIVADAEAIVASLDLSMAEADG